MAINNAVNDGNRTIHSIGIFQGSSTPNYVTLTNGQLLIGSTGVDPVAANITGTLGITVTNGAGSITLSGSGGGMAWVDVTGTSQAMSVNTGYVADNASLVTLTLPTTAAIGDTIAIVGKGAGGWLMAQNASQAAHLGNQVTTTGAGGSLASTNQWDCILITCVTVNNIWVVRSAVGNITYV